MIYDRQVDWMGAAALAGCDSVSVTQTKPPKAWLGTPGEQVCDLMALTEPMVSSTKTR